MVWTKDFGAFSGTRSRYVLVCFAVLSLITATAPKCSAQTWAEIFNQKKTQRKYLVNQIAALQVYIGYARKGYDVVSSGMDAVRDISNGEFSLHSAFISGLKKVNPVISKDVRVAEIVAMQVSILKGFSQLKGTGLLSVDQLAFVAEVADRVVSECYHDLSELWLVITSGKLEMGDKERLTRLDGIYERMLDKSWFTRSFVGEAGLLIRHKSMEQLALERLRRYYEIE